MADYSYANIRIGGTITKKQAEKRLEFIDQEAPMEDERIETIKDLEKIGEEEKVLFLHTAEARWGQFEKLEEYLIKNKIAFDRWSEPYMDDSAVRVVFRPGDKVFGKPKQIFTDPVGTDVVPADPVRSILRLLKYKRFNIAGKKLQKLLPPITYRLPRFRII